MANRQSKPLFAPAKPLSVKKIKQMWMLAESFQVISRLQREFRGPRQGLRRPRLALATLLAFGLVLAACARSGPPAATLALEEVPAPAADSGRIYFYRTDVPLLVAVEPDIIVNGQKVGAAAFERVFYRDAKPGRYEVFLTSDEDSPVYFTLAPGETRYVKAVIDVGFTGTRLRPELVEEGEARAAISQLRVTAPAE